MYEELLDTCPLCGSREVHCANVTTEKEESGYNAECANCQCSTRVYKKPKDAIKAWNNRKQYELKPCPLCGGSAEVGHYGYCGEEIDTDLYAVRCSVCHFSTPNTSEDTLDGVKTIWNTRA